MHIRGTVFKNDDKGHTKTGKAHTAIEIQPIPSRRFQDATHPSISANQNVRNNIPHVKLEKWPPCFPPQACTSQRSERLVGPELHPSTFSITLLSHQRNQ